MKLSDIKGERTLDVIADLIDPIANIVADEKAAVMFKREKLPEGKTAREFVVERLKSSVPVLLKDHKADIIFILSTIEGVTPEEYSEGLTIEKLIVDFIDLFTDGVASSLFTSAQTGDSSGSAQANTVEAKAPEHSQATPSHGMKGWFKRNFSNPT